MSILFMVLPISIMLIFFTLFIWQAAWVALDARKKGEEYWWLWTIAAIIGFPIGIIIYVLVINNDKNVCRDCGKQIPKMGNACPYCGQKCGCVCDSCGQKIEYNWSYCPNCSVKVSGECITKTNKKNNKVLVIIISILVIFVISVGVFLATFSMFGYASRTQFEYATGVNEWPENDGYTGQQYDRSFSDKIVYNIPVNTHSFWYKGEIKRGELTINVIDISGNKVATKVFNDDEFIDVFILEDAKNIEVEFKNFKGSFYYRFN